MVINQGLKKLFAAFLKDHVWAPFSSLCTLTILRVAIRYADDTHTTIASSNIAELIRMTNKELLNISDWLRVNKLSASPQKNSLLLITNVE